MNGKIFIQRYKDDLSYIIIIHEGHHDLKEDNAR